MINLTFYSYFFFVNEITKELNSQRKGNYIPTTRSHCLRSFPVAGSPLLGSRSGSFAFVISSSENILTSLVSRVLISCWVSSVCVLHVVLKPSNLSAEMSIMLWITSRPRRMLTSHSLFKYWSVFASAIVNENKSTGKLKKSYLC